MVTRTRIFVYRKGSKGGNSTPASADPKVENQLNQLKKANAMHKRTIASLKMDANDENAADDGDIEDAGNSFGGKAKKKKGE